MRSLKSFLKIKSAARLQFIGPALLGVFVSLNAAAAIPYKVTFEKSNEKMSISEDLFLENLDAAISDWARHVSSKGELWISIKVDRTAKAAHASSTGMKLRSVEKNHDLYELSGLYKMRTGKAVDPNVPDVEITINPDFAHSTLFVDPSPRKRTTPVPRGKLDLVTLLAHELGHGLGFQGLLDLKTGQPSQPDALFSFDQFVKKEGNHLSFNGPLAMAANDGKPVPLAFVSQEKVVQNKIKGRPFYTSFSPGENVYHLGVENDLQPDPNSPLYSAMSGAWTMDISADGPGVRERVSALDAAILMDLGVPPAPASTANRPVLRPSMDSASIGVD